MTRHPPISTRTNTPFPDPTSFRSTWRLDDASASAFSARHRSARDSAICSARPRSQARDMLILNARACSSRLMSREMLVALRLEEMADLLMRPSLFIRNIYAHDRQRKQPIVEPVFFCCFALFQCTTHTTSDV